MKELYYLIYGFIMGACLVANLKDFRREKEIRTINEIVKREQVNVKYLPEKCPMCDDEIKEIPAGISKTSGKPYRTFWVCNNPDCSFSCNKYHNKYFWRWDKNQNQKSRTSEEKPRTKKLETKQEEVKDTDEIDVSKIPF